MFSVLAEFVLWEFSIVSSLSWYNILVQHAYNNRAWLTFEVLKQNGAGRYAQVPLSHQMHNAQTPWDSFPVEDLNLYI